MEINVEIIVLIFSTLSLILGGFVVLYRKISELEINTATLTERIGNMLEIITEDKRGGENREKRLTIVEHITENLTEETTDLEETTKSMDKRLTAVELEHYSYMNAHN